MRDVKWTIFRTLSLLITISVMVLTLGCQQTKLVFTNTIPAITPEFNQLAGAPNIQVPNSQTTDTAPISLAPEVHPISADFTLHLFPKNPSRLNYIELVLINPNAPFNNIDILNTALNEHALWLASQHPLSCIESLQISARMHSISLKMACPPQEVSQALKILANTWNDSAFKHIDIENVQRKIKLNKHINAYSGAEIDKVWANLILGASHPYNQALDNQELLNNLSKAQLARLQQATLMGAKWHLFMSLADNQQTSDQRSTQPHQEAVRLEKLLPEKAPLEKAAIEKASLEGAYLEKASKNKVSARHVQLAQAKKLATQLASQRAPLTNVHSGSDMVEPIKPNREPNTESGALSRTEKSNSDKIIYLIDAPGSVQTQVRVGYRMPISASGVTPTSQQLSSSDPLSCHLLASWLGRSFSGRLYYDLREKRGLTYGIYGRCFDNPQSRTLKYYGSTQLQHTGAFVAGILDHLELAQTQAIDRLELEALKTYEKSKYTLAMQSQYSAKTQYIKLLTLGRSSHTLINQQARIQTLDINGVAQLAKLNFSSAPFILLRGDSDKIIQDLTDKLPDWKIARISP